MENKNTDRRKLRNILLLAALCLFVVIMVIRIGVLYNRNSRLADELAAKEAESIEMDEKNAALQALMEAENESVLMEQYAREQGYVYPDEHVYIYGN